MKVVLAVLMCKLLVSWINGDDTVLSAEAVVTGVINLSKAFPNRYSFVNSQQTKIALSNISATLSSHVTSFVGIFIYLSFTDHRMLQSLYIYYIAATALAPLEARTILTEARVFNAEKRTQSRRRLFRLQWPPRLDSQPLY